MRDLIFILFILAISITSCTNKNKEYTHNNLAMIETDSIEIKGLNLLKTYCYACHSVTTKSHDEIIAPPMAAVKRRYLRSFATEEEFVKGITNWVKNPTEENALMRGAVEQFKTMPYQAFPDEDIITIAKYIFANELEIPVWFEAHFKEQHPKGMGNGKGQGRGRNKF